MSDTRYDQPRSFPRHNTVAIHNRDIVRVPLVVIVETAPFIAPNMVGNAHVIITRPELVPAGLRLGDWSQVKEKK